MFKCVQCTTNNVNHIQTHMVINKYIYGFIRGLQINIKENIADPNRILPTTTKTP